MCSNSESAVTSSDCRLSVFLADNSAIREDGSLMRASLFLDNSPVLADLVRSFKDNRKLLVSVVSLELAVAPSEISDTLVRLSAETAFSLLPSNNLANKNCLGFNIVQWFFERLRTGVSRFLLFLPNSCSRKLQCSDAIDVLFNVSSLFALKASRSTVCNLSARRHRPWPRRTLQTGQRDVFGLQMTQRIWPWTHCETGGAALSKQIGHSKART